MRSIRRTLEERFVLPKTQRNRELLFGTRFTTIWRSEIHISQKSTPKPWTDAGVVSFFRVQYNIIVKDSEGSMLASVLASTTYSMW